MRSGIACTSGRSTVQISSVVECAGRPLYRAGFSKRKPLPHLHTITRPSTVSATARSQGDGSYQGVYGPWRIEESDVREVLGYRGGISIAAAALLLDAILASGLLDQTPLSFMRDWQNGIALLGAGGFGLSLFLIHIYVAPLKRFLQLLWAVGVLGGISIMATQSQPVTEYVASHPAAVWSVGPLFAAVTGVAFKEGVCYGKPECAVLFFLIPALLIGHLTGLLPNAAEEFLLTAFVGTSLIFAARKYTQAIKDDIGDKSVFMFQALPADEQERLIAQRELARRGDE